MPPPPSRWCTRWRRSTRRCWSSSGRWTSSGSRATSPSPGRCRRTASPTPSSCAQGVKFHDGSDFTSADIKATYERIINPAAEVISARKAQHQDIKQIDTPDPHTVVFRLGQVNMSMLAALRLALQLRLQRQEAQGEPALSRDRGDGDGRLQVRRVRQGLALARGALRPVLPQGPALPRRLPGDLRAQQHGGERPARRPVRRGVPRAHAAGARPAAGDHEGQGHGARGPMGDQYPPDLQRREEAVRRRARAPGPHPRHRPLGRIGGDGQGVADQGRERHLPAGRGVVAADGRARADAGLLARHREVARRGAAAAAGGRPSQPQAQTRQPHHRPAVHPGRHLCRRPVEEDRRGGRACAARDQAVVCGHGGRRVRRRGAEHLRLRRRPHRAVQHAAEQAHLRRSPTRATPTPSSTISSPASRRSSIGRSA